MKTFLTILGVLVLLVVLVVVLAIVFTPWMNRWHTTAEERAAAFPGDDLVTAPKLLINRGVTIKAAPEKIYPWLLQIGADKAGMYSYTALERLTGCEMAKDEVLRAEWQSLKEGDLMKMCAGEFAPPPYIVARIDPQRGGDLWSQRRRRVGGDLAVRAPAAGGWQHPPGDAHQHHHGRRRLGSLQPHRFHDGAQDAAHHQEPGRNRAQVNFISRKCRKWQVRP